MEIKAVKFRKNGFYTQPFVFGGEEGTKLARMVSVLMREKDLRDLLGLIAERGERFHIAANVFARVERTVLVWHLLRSSRRKSRVNEDNLVAGVDQIIL